MEMKRLNIDILGVGEIKWKDEGDFWSDNYRVIYSEDKKSNTGVGIMLAKEWEQRVKNSLPYNNRIMLIKLKTDENDLVIIQTYVPTAGCKDEEVEEICEQLEEVLENVEKNDNLIILVDWNSVVCEGKEGNAVGKYVLGGRNNREKRLIDFCKEKEFIITHTIFQQHPRCRYTRVKH
jgi:exonuclease III